MPSGSGFEMGQTAESGNGRTLIHPQSRSLAVVPAHQRVMWPSETSQHTVCFNDLIGSIAGSIILSYGRDDGHIHIKLAGLTHTTEIGITASDEWWWLRYPVCARSHSLPRWSWRFGTWNGCHCCGIMTVWDAICSMVFINTSLS